MDHIPKISNPKFELPPVPYLGSDHFKYGGKGIFEFASRFRFSFQNRPENDWEATPFLQSWLYFGLLQEFLGLQEIPLLYDDFISHNGTSKVVTTRYLWDYLAAWLIKGSQDCPHILSPYRELKSVIILIGNGKDEREKARKLAKAGLNMLQAISDAMLSIESHRHCITDTVWDSILVLAETLENTLCQAYRFYWIGTNKDFGMTATILGDESMFCEVRSSLVERLFEQQQWCAREKLALNVIFESDVAVLLACLRLNRNCARSPTRHQSCTSRRCVAYQVNEDAYITKHVSDKCSCGFVDVGNIYQRPQLRSKWKRLGRGAAPVATITFKNDQLQVIPVTPFISEAGRPLESWRKEKAGYVAFSHVWCVSKSS